MNLVLILSSSLAAQQPFAAHLSFEEDLALGITVRNGGFDKVEEADTKQTQDFSVLYSSFFLVSFGFVVGFFGFWVFWLVFCFILVFLFILLGVFSGFFFS